MAMLYRPCLHRTIYLDFILTEHHAFLKMKLYVAKQTTELQVLDSYAAFFFESVDHYVVQGLGKRAVVTEMLFISINH